MTASKPGGHPVEALARALAGGERLVALVDVAREQVGGEGVGAGDDDRRHAGDVGGEPSGVQGADVLLRGHQHLAAQVSALLLARELVLPVDAGGARLDERLGELVGVEGSAEAGLGIRHDRREPVLRDFALGVLDLVLADQRVVDAAHDRRHRVRGVEALVGVGLPGEVAVGGDLPAARGRSP